MAVQEKAALSKLRTEIEKAANKLEAERNAWEKKQVRLGSKDEVGRKLACS